MGDKIEKFDPKQKLHLSVLHKAINSQDILKSFERKQNNHHDRTKNKGLKRGQGETDYEINLISAGLQKVTTLDFKECNRVAKEIIQSTLWADLINRNKQMEKIR